VQAFIEAARSPAQEVFDHPVAVPANPMRAVFAALLSACAAGAAATTPLHASSATARQDGATAVAAACALQPYDLRAEWQTGQAFFDGPDPRLSWKLATSPAYVPGNPAFQTAYRVVASTTPARFASGVYDAWDTGVVSSNATINIVYAGIGLDAPSSSVWWSTVVTDAAGVACSAPPPSSVTMGPRNSSDWVASFITSNNTIPTDDCAFYAYEPVPLLRKEFTASSAAAVVDATLFVVGVGYYEAYLNGAKVGDAVLDPAWTTFSSRALYSAFNVTGQVAAGGPNALGLMLGRGWYDPLPMELFGSFNLRDALPVGNPQAIAQLHIAFADGSSQVVGTDSSWRMGAGSTLFNNIYLGEVYDARLDATTAGWSSPGFNDSAWPPALLSTMTGNLGPLRAQTAPHARVTQVVPPASVTQPGGPGSSYVVALPFEISGWLQISGLTGPAGTAVNLTFAEILNPDGSINSITTWAGAIGRGGSNYGPCARVPATQETTVILAGTGNESFVPRFSWQAFRYVQVDGWPVATSGPPSLANFAALRVHSDNAPAGTFVDWNPQHAAIDALTTGSFLANWAGGIQSDCPAR
jgi:alpha-L-rhamnosidase